MMKSAASRWPVTAMLIAMGATQYSAVFGQTPEEQKAWEAQRAQMHADEKAKAELLAKQREARRADPMAWVRTLDPMAQAAGQKLIDAFKQNPSNAAAQALQDFLQHLLPLISDLNQAQKQSAQSAIADLKAWTTGQFATMKQNLRNTQP